MKLKNLFPSGKNAKYTGIGIAVFSLVLLAFVGPRLIKKKEENQAANLPIIAPGSSGGTGLFSSLPNSETAVDTLRMANVYRGRSTRARMGVSPFNQKVTLS